MTFPEQTNRWGSTWTLLDQHGSRAIYEQSDESGTCGFVVMDYRETTRDKTMPNGSIHPAGSFIFPSPEDFGYSAWQFTRKAEGKARALEMMRRNPCERS